MRGLSLVAASGGHSSSQCTGLSLSRPLLLWSTGSRHTGSAIVAHGPSRSAACGILPDQGSNPRPLHWQADSQPLRHQGSPFHVLLILSFVEHFIGGDYKKSKPSQTLVIPFLLKRSKLAFQVCFFMLYLPPKLSVNN